MTMSTQRKIKNYIKNFIQKSYLFKKKLIFFFLICPEFSKKIDSKIILIQKYFLNIFSKTDVWSFGVLMWEIVTLGSTPYPGLSGSEVMKRVREGHRLEKPEHCDREIFNMMFYCWDKDPQERPSFSQLVEDLEKMLTQGTDYIDLNLFPSHGYYNEVSLSGERV